MRVAFINRGREAHPGGDLIMLDCLMAALQKTGVDCEYIEGEWMARTLQSFDLCHLLHINFPWAAMNVSKVCASGKPFIIVPCFYPNDAWGVSYEAMRLAMNMASAVVPLSFNEAREVTRLTGFDGPFHVIPHGTEERFQYVNALSTIGRHGVMTCNARGGKGETVVRRVCDRLGINHAHAQGVDYTDLHKWYQNARVFVHSSPDDRMSLTVGEALCAGCRVISSTGDRGNEWFDGIVACDPEDKATLEALVSAAYFLDKWDWGPNDIARKMTWELAAARFIRVYERVLTEKK